MLQAFAIVVIVLGLPMWLMIRVWKDAREDKREQERRADFERRLSEFKKQFR